MFQIKRLREEGSRLLKEQQELIKKQIEEEKLQHQDLNVTPKLKVRKFIGGEIEVLF